MFAEEIRKQAQKTGQPPGTLFYTGKEKTVKSHITVFTYNNHELHETTGAQLEQCLLGAETSADTITWINVDGLNNIALIDQLTAGYQLHPLTVEDILNVQQRPKVEEFGHYLFITLRVVFWHATSHTFSTEQLSLVMGKNFVLSFQEKPSALVQVISKRLRAKGAQRLREQGSDYLIYRLIDAVVDEYFIVLENLGDRIEALEERIIAAPTPKNSQMLYHLKRQVLLLRKSLWPMREAVSHLLQTETEFITPFTRLYLRDVYDHAIQAIDTLEAFRYMLAGILDVYLSSISNRMNEVMRVLTVIATIFIPMTFIASVFGMNFKYMPELEWHWGYRVVLALMGGLALVMLYFFHRRKWI